MSLQVVIPELLSNTTSRTTGQMSPGDPPGIPVRHQHVCSPTQLSCRAQPAGHNATESGGQLSHLRVQKFTTQKWRETSQNYQFRNKKMKWKRMSTSLSSRRKQNQGYLILGSVTQDKRLKCCFMYPLFLWIQSVICNLNTRFCTKSHKKLHKAKIAGNVWRIGQTQS